MARILLAAWLALPIPMTAVDIGGTWNVIIPAGSEKRPNGGTADWKEIRGTLTVTQKGSDLQGTWRALDEWSLTGRVDDEGRFALESGEREIPATRNGRKERVPARWVIRGALKDGALAGTAALAIADSEPLFHKWTATKK
jgi:hypothetical protein